MSNRLIIANRHRAIAFLLVLGGSLLLMILSKSNSSADVQKPQTERRVMANVWGWTTASWDGNDKPYQQIRATIDNAIAGGRKPQELMKLYEMQARKAPNDPLARFRWAYAAYKTAGTVDYNAGENILGNPRDALVLGPFPHTYEYARLIFLTEDYAGMFTHELQPVGERLLRRNPYDLEVKYGVAGNLMFNQSQADRSLALKYIEELIRVEPERPHPQALLGLFYYQRWLSSKSKADAVKAIAGYNQYLQYAPPVEADFAQRVRQRVVEMQKG